jgi:hypothetical protein
MRCAIVAVLAPLLLSSCGEGAEEEGPGPVPKALPGSPPELEAALLTIEDLGDGWVDIGPTPFEERGLEACPATNVVTSEEDPSRVGEAQTHFLREDEPPTPPFFQSVSVWESEQAAQERLATFATSTATCVGVAERTPDGRAATVTFTERPVPELGDQTVGQTVRFDFAEGPDATLELLAVRLRNVVVLTNAERSEAAPDRGLDSAEFLALTREAVDKVTRSLPVS